MRFLPPRRRTGLGFRSRARHVTLQLSLGVRPPSEAGMGFLRPVTYGRAASAGRTVGRSRAVARVCPAPPSPEPMPPTPRRALRRFGPLASALALAGCLDIAAPPDIGGGRLVGISMTSDAVVEVGDTVRLAASGNVSGLIGMLMYDPLADAAWAVTDTTIARVEPVPPRAEDSIQYARARLTGVRRGAVQVVVTAGGVRSEAPARVVPVAARIALRAPRHASPSSCRSPSRSARRPEAPAT